MDAETLALQLQQQLHDQQQARLLSIEREQGEARRRQLEQAETLAKIAANTECLPELVERVDTLERTDSKHRGAFGVLGVAWAGLLALIEWYSHR